MSDAVVGSGGGGGPTGFRHRQRGSNGNSNSNQNGNSTNVDSAASSGIVPNSSDRTTPAAGSSSGSNSSGSGAGGSSAGNAVAGASQDDCKDETTGVCGERRQKGGVNLRPSTASQRQCQQLVPSPRLGGLRPGSRSGSRSEPTGGDVGSNWVGGGIGSRGGDESTRAAAAVAAERVTAASDISGDIVKIHVCDESRGITRGERKCAAACRELGWV